MIILGAHKFTILQRMSPTMKFLVATLLILFVVVFWSCEETTNFDKEELFSPTVQGKLAIDTLYAEMDTTFSIPEQSTRASDRLLVGSYAGFECRPIIRYTVLPTNATISEARIKFTTAGITGDNPQPFTIKAHPIKNDWLSNTDAIWDNYQDNIDSSITLGTLQVTSDASDTLVMQMDSAGLDYFNRWANEDSSEFNYGFLLDFENANFIKEFNSNRNPRGPQLVLTYTPPSDTTRKDSVISTSDAFLIDSNFNRVANRDYIISLTPWVTLLQFNTGSLLNKYPEGITIVSANLQLAVDKANTHLHQDFGAFLHILRLTSDLDDNMVVIDSSVFGSSVYTIDIRRISDDSSYIDINPSSERSQFARRFIQDLIEDPQPIKKLYVGFSDNIDFLSYIALLKSGHRLIVEYWIPPDRRF